MKICPYFSSDLQMQWINHQWVSTKSSWFKKESCKYFTWIFYWALTSILTSLCGSTVPEDGTIWNSLAGVLRLDLPRVTSPLVADTTSPSPSPGTLRLKPMGTKAVFTKVATSVLLKPWGRRYHKNDGLGAFHWKHQFLCNIFLIYWFSMYTLFSWHIVKQPLRK